MKKIVLLLGAPCSGKGTQGQRISKYIECISAGEILRKRYPRGTPEREELDDGKLIDIDKVNGIMLEYIKAHDFRVVLDGYPRSVDQARFIRSVGEEYGVTIEVIVLNAADTRGLEERMHKRTYCEDCGDTFDEMLECCDRITIKRSDDNKVTFGKRLRVYEENIDDVLSMFDNKHILNAYDEIESLALKIKYIINS